VRYHIQKPGVTLTAYCGRRVGTPGGKIYPGVQAMLPSWFKTHRYPEIIDAATCKACRKNYGKEPER